MTIPPPTRTPTAPDHPVDLVPIFDLDGTLLDSDQALVAPFLTLGVRREDISFGHVIGEECARLGIDVDAYVECYDTDAAQPFPGVRSLLAGLDRWAVCSNKHPVSGRIELERLGWEPEVALFTDAFAGPKQLAPVLERLALAPEHALYVGDTAHDRACAVAAGVPFVLAGWNARAQPAPGDLVLDDPQQLLPLLRGTASGTRP